MKIIPPAIPSFSVMDYQHLDDNDEAKLWLPSNSMFPSEVIPSKYYFSSNMDHHLPSLLQNRPARNLYSPPPKPTPCSQCIRPVVPDVSVNHLLPGYPDLGLNGGVEVGQRLYGNGTGHRSTRFDPVYNFQVKQQVDDYLETRARVLQKQQNRLLQNRVYPFQGNRLGLGGGGGGGLRKESGGTGVFHPRIVNLTTSTGTNVLKKKQAGGPRNRQESPLTQQRYDRKWVGVSKREDNSYHLSPEMALPRDWAY